MNKIRSINQSKVRNESLASLNWSCTIPFELNIVYNPCSSQIWVSAPTTFVYESAEQKFDIRSHFYSVSFCTYILIWSMIFLYFFMPGLTMGRLFNVHSMNKSGTVPKFRFDMMTYVRVPSQCGATAERRTRDRGIPDSKLPCAICFLGNETNRHC